MRINYHFLFTVVAFSAGVVIADDADESKFIEKVELLGGTVERDDNLPNRPVVGVSFIRSQRFNDKHLQLLKACKRLTKLDISCIGITDVGLTVVGELTNLTARRQLFFPVDDN